MSISDLAVWLGVVLPVASGCSLWDKSGTTTNYDACFAKAGPGLPAGWIFDSTHWACESSPISKPFEVYAGTFPFNISQTQTAWDEGATPWNAAAADLTITRVSGYLDETDQDDHNAVYYLPSDHHPSQIGWLAATLCHASGSSPEATDCDTRVFGRSLDQADDPNLPGDQSVDSAISWTNDNTTSTGEYRMPMVFAHELHHAIGFGHNDGIGSITETLVSQDYGAPSSLINDDENALLWVYGQ